MQDTWAPDPSRPGGSWPHAAGKLIPLLRLLPHVAVDTASLVAVLLGRPGGGCRNLGHSGAHPLAAASSDDRKALEPRERARLPDPQRRPWMALPAWPRLPPSAPTSHVCQVLAGLRAVFVFAGLPTRPRLERLPQPPGLPAGSGDTVSCSGQSWLALPVLVGRQAPEGGGSLAVAFPVKPWGRSVGGFPCWAVSADWS